jgi:Cu-Zn family superoxide dismutase
MRLVLFFIFTFLFSASAAFAAKGAALIQPTQKDSNVSGEVLLEETSEGLKIAVEVGGAAPGKHGLHIHENGSCADGGQAAGGHYNPRHAPHGFLPEDGVEKAHAGDLGNIEIGPDGSGRLETFLEKMSLTDPSEGVKGRAVILHEKEDDFGQPVGNAGGRIGCGVIK